MKIIEGNIVDVVKREIFKGRIFFENNISKIERIEYVNDTNFILPGFIDAHLHIESTMLTPVEYSKIALKHGVIAAITDPHEIANVCGIDGINYMIDNAKKTPMKIYFGAPSCVPATPFENNGAIISAKEIEALFKSKKCFQLSEMMNFPGVINDDKDVWEKIKVAKKYNRKIDGHAPLLSGEGLKKYIEAGISTDHETTKLDEALEKIKDGMKIILRNSSASRDFLHLISLIETHPNKTMMCTDDCHPDDLEKGYINEMVKTAIEKGYNVFDVISIASKNAKDHYGTETGLLQLYDPADFIVIDNFKNFNIKKVFVNGIEQLNEDPIKKQNPKNEIINNFHQNKIFLNDVRFPSKNKKINAIRIIEDSIITKKEKYQIKENVEYFESETEDDILKIVIVNRYKKAKPTVGFVNGFNLKKGAIGSSVAHDSHNIVVIGVSDKEICKAISSIQESKGGLVAVNGNETHLLPLPIGGIMSDKSCEEVSRQYKSLNNIAKEMGCKIHAPFMTLSFMSLLVIPEIKIGDMGLFDVNKFSFINVYDE
ncbi:MAG: adenine deaminase [Prolixibacteraceae bacterium]|nr:adenine deaminase [Prolixibacteraceae bacterium]